MASIDGCFSNSNDLFKLCRLRVDEMKILFKHQLSFNLMNYFIINLLDKVIRNCEMCDNFEIAFWQIQDFIPGLTEKDLKKSLNRLKKMGLIEFAKFKNSSGRFLIDMFSIRIL